LATGKKITDKYRIEEVLGEGGFGITYKAKHLTLGSFCVIKTPRTKFRQDSRYWKRKATRKLFSCKNDREYSFLFSRL